MKTNTETKSSFCPELGLLIFGTVNHETFVLILQAETSEALTDAGLTAERKYI